MTSPSMVPQCPSEALPDQESRAKRLAHLYIELAEINIQYAWMYRNAWQSSSQPSVAGKDREANFACLPIEQDRLRLNGEIESLKVLLAYD